MEIAKDIKLITNVEVYQALKEWKGDNMLTGSGEFPWTKSAVIRYLEMTPACHLSDEKIQNFLRELDNFEVRHGVHLTPNERMQMLNIVPVQAVDIHTVIEECPERMSDEVVDELVSIVTNNLLYFCFA